MGSSRVLLPWLPHKSNGGAYPPENLFTSGSAEMLQRTRYEVTPNGLPDFRCPMGSVKRGFLLNKEELSRAAAERQAFNKPPIKKC